jgi:hypothetical protein
MIFELRDGVLYWKVTKPRSRIRIGSVAGTVNNNSYVRIELKNVNYLAHRIVYYMHYGIDPCDLQVDHINGIKSDNRPDNLRLATNAENAMNRQGPAVNSTSGIRGVSWNKAKRKWMAYVFFEGKNKHLGYFETKTDAESSSIKARAELFGEFAGCST